MKIIEYFTKDGPPKLKYRKKTVEVPKVKCELFFVGRNGELENYVESYTGDSAEISPEEIVKRIGMVSWFNGFGREFVPSNKIFLPNNNRSMNMEYYTLAKVVIKDVKQVKIEIEEPYYEEE